MQVADGCHLAQNPGCALMCTGIAFRGGEIAMGSQLPAVKEMQHLTYALMKGEKDQRPEVPAVLTASHFRGRNKHTALFLSTKGGPGHGLHVLITSQALGALHRLLKISYITGCTTGPHRALSWQMLI